MERAGRVQRLCLGLDAVLEPDSHGKIFIRLSASFVNLRGKNRATSLLAWVPMFKNRLFLYFSVLSSRRRVKNGVGGMSIGRRTWPL